MKPVDISEDSQLLFNSVANSERISETGCSQSIGRMRYLMAALCWFSLICSFFLKTNLSIAIVDMISGHGTASWHKSNWNSKLQGVILSSFFWGYTATQIPGGIIASRYGTKICLACGISVNVLLSFFTPICTKNGGSTVLILIRVVGGLLLGMTFPCYIVIFSKWSPVSERSGFIASTNSGMMFGPVISFFMGGQMVHTFGWESIFYFTGSLGVVWLFLWIIFASDLPEDNPFISQKEIKYITENRGTVRPYLPIKEIPWKDLLTSLPFISVLVVYFSNNWGMFVLMIQLPTYMKSVFQVDIQKSGFFSGIPFIVQALMLIISGHLSDFVIKKSFASTKLVRRWCVCLGSAFQTLFLVLVANSDNFTTAVIFVSCVSGFSGVTMAGFHPNILDIAPNFVGPMEGIANSLGSLTAICVPLVTGMIVTDQSSVEEWKFVFYISASLFVVSCLVFGYFSSGTVELD